MGLARQTGEEKMKNLWIIGVIVILYALFGTACGDDDGTSNGPDEDSGVDSGSECEEYPASYDRVCPHEIGECMVMEDCPITGYCEIYSVVPWDTDAQCMDPPPADTTRFTGVVRDFETNDVLPEVTVRFADGATVLGFPDEAYDKWFKFEVTSDVVDGTFEWDQEWIVKETDLGVVSLIQEEGYFYTGTGFVEPTADLKAPTGALNHHAMAISETLVVTLKELAAADPAVSKYEPNVFGKVQYADLMDGAGKSLPVQGATIKNEPGSQMQIFYVNENMDGLTACATASHGMFIVADIGTKAKLRTYRGDTPIDYYDHTMGNTPQALVFAVIVSVYSADDPEAPAINCN
jgi:hypothetical protein